MRTSNKILITLVIVLLVGLVILVASFRGFAGRIMKDAPPAGSSVMGSENRVERTYDVEGFTGIESSGGWEVVVTQGDRYEVKVTAPENIHDVLRIRREGDNLVLSFKPGYAVSNARTSAVIVMPNLQRLSGSGGAAFTFNGFSGQGLDIEIAGGATVQGAGGRYDRVAMEISGAAHVDLKEVTAVNADVELSGAGNIELTMAGGELAGSLSGAANLTYYGEVSRVEVEKAGLASISHE